MASYKKVNVLYYHPEIKGSKIGTLDLEIVYSDTQKEIFRNLSLFSKDGKKWLSVSNCKRDEQWLPSYERTPSLKQVFSDMVEEVASLCQFAPQSL